MLPVIFFYSQNLINLSLIMNLSILLTTCASGFHLQNDKISGFTSFFSWKIFSIEIAHWRIKQTKNVQFSYWNKNKAFSLVCTYSLLHTFQVCFSGLQVLGSTPETTRSSLWLHSTLTFTWCENRKPNATTHQDCCLLFNGREKSCL